MSLLKAVDYIRFPLEHKSFRVSTKTWHPELIIDLHKAYKQNGLLFPASLGIWALDSPSAVSDVQYVDALLRAPPMTQEVFI